jgi:hypothetical protein
VASEPTDKSKATKMASPQPGLERRKRYVKPAIVTELKLESRAGSPVSDPLDPMNTPNEYGL